MSGARALALPGGRWVLPGNRADLLDDVHPHDPPEVSVVVPHYRQQAQLDLVLTGLAHQTHPRSRLQVLVVDDGSPVRPVVHPAAAGLDVRVLAQDDLGFRAAAARNLGAAAADGEVLCFLDADTVPEPGYVARVSRLPALAPDALVTGRRRHADLTGWTPAGLLRWFGDGPGPTELDEPEWLAVLSAGLAHADDGSYRAVISAVMTCSRELFTEVGGFDETFTSYGGEDWELAHRMWTAGAVLAHERSAVAWHDGPDWAGRPDDRATAVAQKAAETRAVARRVPVARTGPAWFPWPEVVLRAPGSDPAAAVRVALGSGLDIGVWTEVDLGWSDVRVHTGEVPQVVLERARVVVDGVPPTPLHAAVELVRPGAAGAVRWPGGRVRATRALRRARRHGPALGLGEDAALGVLFGVTDTAPSGARG